MVNYEGESAVFKALSDPTRLKIIDILSCGEMCACEILEGLSIAQPTLSHHMKVLMECGLVYGRKNATWMYYSISREGVGKVHRFIDFLTNPKEDCICRIVRMNCTQIDKAESEISDNK